MFNQPPNLHLDFSVSPLYDRVIAFLGIRFSLDSSSSRSPSRSSHPHPRRPSSSRSHRSLAALLRRRPSHHPMVFTGKVSPAQLAPTTVVMHRAEVKRLLDRLLAAPPSARSLLVTHTHTDGITDDLPLNTSDKARTPSTGPLLLPIFSTPTNIAVSSSNPNPPKNPVPFDAGVNSSSITVPEPSAVIQSTPNDARLVPSSDSSHSGSTTPITQPDSTITITSNNNNNSQLETPPLPSPPIPIISTSSTSSSRTSFDPSTFEPKSARRPSQHALGHFSPLRQSWTSDDLFGEGMVFEEDDDFDEEDTETVVKKDDDEDDDDDSSSIKCKWVICGEEEEEEDELDDVNDLIKFFETARGRPRTKSFAARCDGSVNVGAGANIPAYVQVIVS